MIAQQVKGHQLKVDAFKQDFAKTEEQISQYELAANALRKELERIDAEGM